MTSSSDASDRQRHRSTPSSHRLPTPKTTEVWDEDFEFPTLALPKGKKAETPRKSDAGSRPEENWEEEEENWDESPPGPSRLPIASLGKRKSPTQPDIAKLSLNSPRASGSISSGRNLPRSPTSPGQSSGISASSSALQLVAGQSTIAGGSKQRLRSGSTGRKLVKRHPSTSFINIGSSSSVDDPSSIPPVPANRSSYDLSRPVPSAAPPFPRSKSGEQMPPPAVPSGSTRPRSKPKSKVRPTSRPGEIRVSAIPLSPSQDHIDNVDAPRRPSFWKRLSGQPLGNEPVSAPGGYIQDSIKLQHRRSASIGRLSKREQEERPPVPPIPANLRSPSATSTASTTSASSSNRSAPTTLSAILRRTASGLSRKSSNDRPPPSSFPYGNRSHQGSNASINSVPPTPPLPDGIASSSRRSPLSPPPPSHSFSAGYHLPSPSPHSPYRPALDSTVVPASLPHSTSFPTARSIPSDSDTENEEEDLEQTPRRKKIRPVSALPAPRMGINRGWNAEGWRGFSDQGIPGSSKIFDQAKRSASSETPGASTSSPRTANFAMSTANTIRRIGSISKKHGRRLSGGLMFGGPASSGKEGSSSTFLEPVQGSPSKPRRSADDSDHDEAQTSWEQEESFDEAREMRDGSASAPSSTFRHAPFAPGMNSSMSEATITGTQKTDKERRRQSWNDFVIPKSIMEMQSGLNKNRSAIKQFDAGIKRLEALLDSRERARQAALSSFSGGQTYDQLEAEFREEWAIASVLVRVGNTGRAEASGVRVSSDSGGIQDSPRSRRITMGTDEAKAAGEALRSASDGTTPLTSGLGTRMTVMTGTSPPSPISPRALSDKWRASTGRHDLTPRELELLRNIMSTPVSQRPSSGARQASTISSSSSIPSIRPSGSSKTITGSATVRHIPKLSAPERSTSRVRLPSPSDSPFIIESGTFPSPNTASALAAPKSQKGQKGFAGFKDFLRTMSTKSNVPSSPSARRLNFMASPSSPAFPVKSPLIPGSSPQPSIESAMQATPGLSDRQKKRTSVRNIFRSSSGDWSGLVKGETKSEPPVPPLGGRPSQPNLGLVKQISPKRRVSMKQKQKQEAPLPPLDPGPTDDRTIRPSQNQGRKSRIIGLGWPEIEDGLPTGSSSAASTPPRPPPIRRSTTSDKETTAAAQGYAHVKDGTEYSTWSKLPEPDVDGKQQQPRAPSAQSDDFTVVLTPENLPRMLEYVQECEKTLGVWKTRARSLLSE